jgi:hypothetical protein
MPELADGDAQRTDDLEHQAEIEPRGDRCR